MTDWEDELATSAPEEPTPIYNQLYREQRAAFWARLGFKEEKK